MKGMLYKQGSSVNKKTEARLVTMTQHALKWFHNESERKADAFLGCVKLPFIYEVIRSKQVHNQRPTFSISVTMFIDKNGAERGKRDLFFSCDTE
jgi:hypothetical protein